jgi:hypothetical protein
MNFNENQNPCKICTIDPTSHSFQIIPSINQQINLFYSCPAKATKYFESEGVIEHFRSHLQKNNGKPWAYVLDCEGFTLRHATQIQTSMALVDMITGKYGDSLKKVWIINPTWTIQIMIRAMMPILTNRLRSIIETTDMSLDQIQGLSFF